MGDAGVLSLNTGAAELPHLVPVAVLNRRTSRATASVSATLPTGPCGRALSKSFRELLKRTTD
jgi:hypothetical protein